MVLCQRVWWKLVGGRGLKGKGAKRDAFNSSPALLLKEKGGRLLGMCFHLQALSREVQSNHDGELSGTRSTLPPINWGHGPGPSLKREGRKTNRDVLPSTSFRLGGSKQQKGLFHASSLETDGGWKEGSCFPLQTVRKL